MEDFYVDYLSWKTFVIFLSLKLVRFYIDQRLSHMCLKLIIEHLYSVSLNHQNSALNGSSYCFQNWFSSRVSHGDESKRKATMKIIDWFPFWWKSCEKFCPLNFLRIREAVGTNFIPKVVRRWTGADEDQQNTNKISVPLIMNLFNLRRDVWVLWWNWNEKETEGRLWGKLCKENLKENSITWRSTFNSVWFQIFLENVTFCFVFLLWSIFVK